MSSYQEEIVKIKKRELAMWKEVNAGVTGIPPEKHTWINIDDIISVLDRIGKHEVSNHTFMPSGGGLDLAGASKSHEEGLIELNFDGSAKLVKPKSLTFHAVGENPEWWYLRLETDRFAPTGVYNDSQNENPTDELIPWTGGNEVDWSMQYIGEELLEVSPGPLYGPTVLGDESFRGR